MPKGRPIILYNRSRLDFPLKAKNVPEKLIAHEFNCLG